MKNAETGAAGGPRVVGIWIDHEKAYIVSLFQDREDVLTIESGVRKRIRLAGESRTAATPHGQMNVATDGRTGRRRRAGLHEFYTSVIEKVRDADSVYILGPGKAKEEFLEEAGRSKEFMERLAAVETVRRMSKPQIVAKTRAFFAKRDGCSWLKSPRRRTSRH